MLKPEHCVRIKEELDYCKKPIFFFHDDPDGTTSFLQCYKYKGDGKGVIIKATPRVDAKFIRTVQEYGADKVFVLDLAMVDQDFIDGVGIPVVWIDHHAPLQRQNVLYFNPRTYGENSPPCYMMYQVLGEHLWISMVGSIGDWFYPPYVQEFHDKYPDLLPEVLPRQEDIMFTTPLGKLVHIFAFNIKGSTKDALASIKVMTRIEDPYEILEQKSSRGKFLYKRYETILKEYNSLKKAALAGGKHDGKYFIYFYNDDRLSLTKDLSNELLYMMPDKITILAREKDGHLKMSLRSGRDGPVINNAVLKAAGLIPGVSGGGHEHACGANVPKEHFEQFLAILKEECGE